MGYLRRICKKWKAVYLASYAKIIFGFWKSVLKFKITIYHEQETNGVYFIQGSNQLGTNWDQVKNK